MGNDNSRGSWEPSTSMIKTSYDMFDLPIMMERLFENGWFVSCSPNANGAIVNCVVKSNGFCSKDGKTWTADTPWCQNNCRCTDRFSTPEEGYAWKKSWGYKKRSVDEIEDGTKREEIGDADDDWLDQWLLEKLEVEANGGTVIDVMESA
ncbi:hypothetical protein N0V88_006312 [Collariella sp. IMI 366227]|nr:hypothetical protein N0V88_006312 [Collariella sp. IMI 366227]